MLVRLAHLYEELIYLDHRKPRASYAVEWPQPSCPIRRQRVVSGSITRSFPSSVQKMNLPLLSHYAYDYYFGHGGLYDSEDDDDDYYCGYSGSSDECDDDDYVLDERLWRNIFVDQPRKSEARGSSNETRETNVVSKKIRSPRGSRRNALRQKLRASFKNLHPWDTYPEDSTLSKLVGGVDVNLLDWHQRLLSSLTSRATTIPTRVYFAMKMPRPLQTYVKNCYERSRTNLLVQSIEKAVVELRDMESDLKEAEALRSEQSTSGATGKRDPVFEQKYILVAMHYAAMAHSSEALVFVFNRAVKIVEFEFENGPDKRVRPRSTSDAKSEMAKMLDAGAPGNESPSLNIFRWFWVLLQLQDDAVPRSSRKLDDFFPSKHKSHLKEALRSFLVSCCRLRLDELLRSVLVSDDNDVPRLKSELSGYLREIASPSVKNFLAACEAKTASKAPSKTVTGVGASVGPVASVNRAVNGSAVLAAKGIVGLDAMLIELRTRNIIASTSDPKQFVEHVYKHTLPFLNLATKLEPMDYGRDERVSLRNIQRTIAVFPHFVIFTGRILQRTSGVKQSLILRAIETFLREVQVCEEVSSGLLKSWLDSQARLKPMNLLEKLRENLGFKKFSVEIVNNSGLRSRQLGVTHLLSADVLHLLSGNSCMENFAQLYTTTDDWNRITS